MATKQPQWLGKSSRPWEPNRAGVRVTFGWHIFLVSPHLLSKLKIVFHPSFIKCDTLTGKSDQDKSPSILVKNTSNTWLHRDWLRLYRWSSLTLFLTFDHSSGILVDISFAFLKHVNQCCTLYRTGG